MSNQSKIKYDHIPNNWDIVFFRNTCKITSGFAFESKWFTNNKEIPVIKIANIGHGDFIDKGQEYLPKRFLQDYKEFIVMPGSILLALTRPITNDSLKVCVYPPEFPIGLLNQRVAVIKPLTNVDKKYIYYYLKSNGFKIQVLANMSETLQPNLSPTKLNEFVLPLPPLNEQKRIILKIEELFTKLEAGISYLKKIQILLKQYRQSILKYALEGKLTKKWREKNKHRLESADLILIKIKNIKDDNNKFNSDLWTNTKLRNLVINERNDIVDGPFGSNLHKDEYVNNGVPLVRLQNVDRNKFINKNIRFITEKKAIDLKRHNYTKGDILITKLGIPVGKACIVPEDLTDGIIVADIVRMRLNHQYVNNRYVVYAINSPQIIDQFPKPKGTTRPRVNLNHIRDLEIPLAPLYEQKEICRKIEYYFSIIDHSEKVVTSNIIQSNVLAQSILKHGFEGKLVPQYSDDEPASLLIENIKQKESLLSKGQNLLHNNTTDKQYPKQTKLPF